MGALLKLKPAKHEIKSKSYYICWLNEDYVGLKQKCFTKYFCTITLIA